MELVQQELGEDVPMAGQHIHYQIEMQQVGALTEPSLDLGV